MLEELAPAKVNLALAVLGVREDGYHEVDTVMHSIELSDSVYLAAADDTVFSCDKLDIPCGPGNLAYDALQLMRRYTGRRDGVRIDLRKRIPHGAGLGGGSTDAAAVLRGLNRLWKLGLSPSELRWLARQLGTDTIFCLVGGAARGTGRGDVLQALPPLPPTELVLVRAPVTVATAHAYQAYDRAERTGAVDVTGMVNALREGAVGMVSRRLGNVFESVLLADMPALAEVKHAARKMGLPVLMSGTGSAFFIVAESARESRHIARRLQERYPSWQVWCTRTRGEMIDEEE